MPVDGIFFHSNDWFDFSKQSFIFYMCFNNRKMLRIIKNLQKKIYFDSFFDLRWVQTQKHVCVFAGNPNFSLPADS